MCSKTVGIDEIKQLKRKACEARAMIIRMVYDGGSGHCGGSLSIVDILSVLYFREMRFKADDPLWPGRDRFVLSKGHACPALYAVLAMCGVIDERELKGFRQAGSILQGHPEYGTPGVEAVGGSLGQGFSAALGMALGARLSGKGRRVYTAIGDGEAQEGMVWETAMAGGHFGLDNLTCFLDRNDLQGDGPTEDLMTLEPLKDKWLAFNWEVREIDGHDITEIIEAIEWARGVKGRPQMIIAKTVKGKGVSFMEGVAAWHGTAPPTESELAQALSELKAVEEGLR